MVICVKKIPIGKTCKFRDVERCGNKVEKYNWDSILNNVKHGLRNNIVKDEDQLKKR